MLAIFQLPRMDGRIISSGIILEEYVVARIAPSDRKFPRGTKAKQPTVLERVTGSEYCQSHLPAARDSTTFTISGRRRAASTPTPAGNRLRNTC